MKITIRNGSDLRMIHVGIHNHRAPHPIRATLTAKTQFKKLVLAAPEVKPKQLLIGTPGRAPIGELHSSYNHLDRAGSQRRMELKKVNPTSSIGMLGAFEKRIGCKIIYSSGFNANNGHITCITEFQQECLQNLCSSLQTDTIEGFVADKECPNANVTMTTAFNCVLNRNVPVVISILMGKTEHHYKAHFTALFQAMNLSTDFGSWEGEFPGNTCDFSDAERAGFQAAVRQYCHIDEEEEIQWEKFYRCCTLATPPVL